jgi:6-phosphogluconolactonase
MSMRVSHDKGELEIYDDASALIKALDKRIFDLSEEAIAREGVCTISLSGGSTPKALYEHMASVYNDKYDWANTLWFLGDERCVPHDDDESNFKMINTALFSKVPLPKENIFATENQDTDPKDAAAKYESKMVEVIKARSGQVPVFDIILLGLGPDGHTASLFPGSKALEETERYFVENWVDKFQSYRLTSTYPLLNCARNVIFLVSGNGKAEIVDRVLNSTEQKYPAQNVRPTAGKLRWFLDKPAVEAMHFVQSSKI